MSFLVNYNLIFHYFGKNVFFQIWTLQATLTKITVYINTVQVILNNVQPIKMYRSSRPEIFCEKMNVLQHLQENTCVRFSFLIKLQAEACRTLLKKRLWRSCSPVNFPNFLRTAVFIEHFWLLLLDKLWYSACANQAYTQHY